MIMAIPQALIVAVTLLVQAFQPKSAAVAHGAPAHAPSVAIIIGTIVVAAIFFVGYMVLYSVAHGYICGVGFSIWAARSRHARHTA